MPLPTNILDTVPVLVNKLKFLIVTTAKRNNPDQKLSAIGTPNLDQEKSYRYGLGCGKILSVKVRSCSVSKKLCMVRTDLKKLRLERSRVDRVKDEIFVSSVADPDSFFTDPGL